MNEMMLIAGMMLATFLTRYPMMLLVSKVEIPREVMRAFKYVPIAVLSAIISPLIFLQGNQMDLSTENHFLLAALISGLVSWKSRNLLLTIVVGMAALFIFRAIF